MRNYPKAVIYDVITGEVLTEARLAPSRINALIKAYNRAGFDAVAK